MRPDTRMETTRTPPVIPRIPKPNLVRRLVVNRAWESLKPGWLARVLKTFIKFCLARKYWQMLPSVARERNMAMVMKLTHKLSFR